MRFFDSHAHLSAPPLLEDIDPIADRAQRAEVGAIVNICTDLDSLDAGLSIARRHPFIAGLRRRPARGALSRLAKRGSITSTIDTPGLLSSAC
jgi:Tat protein secretion system quality control protein TatD with DNase activity